MGVSVDDDDASVVVSGQRVEEGRAVCRDDHRHTALIRSFGDDSEDEGRLSRVKAVLQFLEQERRRSLLRPLQVLAVTTSSENGC